MDSIATFQDQYIGTNLKTIPISSEVVKFGAIGFLNETIETVVLSQNVKFLDLLCLHSKGIKNIVSHNVNPPITSTNLIDGLETIKSITVTIPREAYYDYISAPLWKLFGHYHDFDGNELIAIENITINQEHLTLKVNESYKLGVTVSPQNIDFTAIYWESSDTTVCIVNQEGLVTATRPGNTSISVKHIYNPKCFATCNVTVGNDSGIENVVIENEEYVFIYNLQGILIYRGLWYAKNVPSGVYIVNSRNWQGKYFID